MHATAPLEERAQPRPPLTRGGLEPDRPPSARARCPVCGEAIEGPDVVGCASCRVPHHRDCWRYAGGCAIYGCCGGLRRLRPGPPAARKPSALAASAEALVASTINAWCWLSEATATAAIYPFGRAFALARWLGPRTLCFVAVPIIAAATGLVAVGIVCVLGGL